MTREELKMELEKVEKAQFFLAMKDRWQAADFKRDRELTARARELQGQLGEG